MTTNNLKDIHAIAEAGIRFHIEQKWDFDLREFCSLVEKLCKFLIQAREKVAPGLLGPPKAYRQWGLQNLVGKADEATFDSLTMLRNAKATSRLISDAIHEMCNFEGV